MSVNRKLVLDLRAAIDHRIRSADLRQTFGRVWFTANGDYQVRCSTMEEAQALLNALTRQRSKPTKRKENAID